MSPRRASSGAAASSSRVGRTRTRIELWSDQQGVQVFTGNFGVAIPSLDGGTYRAGDGIALEPQLFPDTPHHPEWPTAVLRPGETYRSRIEWRCGATENARKVRSSP